MASTAKLSDPCVCRLYSVSKEAEANDEIDIEETDRMGQLRDEASYSAFKLPLSEEADQAAMKSFYDPTGSGTWGILGRKCGVQLCTIETDWTRLIIMNRCHERIYGPPSTGGCFGSESG